MPKKKVKKKARTKVAMGDKPKNGTGYTKKSGTAAQRRNCKAVGGKWVGGKCVGGAA